MADIPLPFGEWLPDLGENENPGLVEAKNVVARPGGYAPIGSVSEGDAGVAPLSAADPLASAFAYTNSTGGTSIDYGNPANLYASGNVTALSSSGMIESVWRFAQFDGSIYAVRPGSTSASTSSNLYSHAISSPLYANVAAGTGLRGRNIARVGQFLMLGGTNDVIGSSSINDYFFRWSAFNDPTSWAVSQTTQAGVANVIEQDYGPITGLVGGRFGLLFQSYGISRISYVGPPKVWQEAPISRGIGCAVPRSIITVDDITYFFAHDGVCATDGVSVQRIGFGRVDDWMLRALRATRPIYVRAGFLPDYQSIMWSFGRILNANLDFTNSITAGLHLIYNTKTGRFSYAEVQNGGIISGPVPSGGQPDGSEFVSGYVINASADPMTYAAFGGPNLAAEVTTGYTALTPGRRIAINNVEPVYDGSGAKVAVNTKATQAGAATLGTPVAVNSDGIADLRADGRLAAVSVTFDAAATWSELKGAVVTGDVSGAR